MDNSQDELLNKYKILPQDIQDAMFSLDTSRVLQQVGRNNGLNVEKIGILADEVGLFMLGITNPNDFIPNLAKRLNLDRESARKIGQEINEKIFSKIRESLKLIHQTEETNKETPAAPAGPETILKIPKVISPDAVVETPAAPATEPTQPPQAAAAESSGEPKETKDIFKERYKEEGFHSSPEIKEKTYPQKQDPYREPID